MIWDEQHLKALLRLPRFPKHLLDEDPWASWLNERRGVEAVRDSLRRAPLLPFQRELLELILNHPNTFALKHAAMLHVSLSTYFRCLRTLVESLLEYLNNLDLVEFERVENNLGLIKRDAPVGHPVTNLPLPLTPLVGAEVTLQRIVDLLAQAEVRLVTLMGTGGIGKTRLAIQAARAFMENASASRGFNDGVFLVDLAPLHNPDLVLVEIAQVLNLTERSGHPILELLQRELSDRSLLLILDNFEHLLAAAPMVTALLQRTARLKILVTSRAALNVAGEHRLAIPPLSLPSLAPLPALEDLSRYDAIQLFVQRARAIDDTFALTPDNAAAVARLCAELDGLPLALEMAATRINHLSPQMMLALLGQRLQWLASGARDTAPRHQTLRNLIDWSYQLLDADEQLVFRSLAAFANGWTLEAMESVCALPVSQAGGLTPAVEQRPVLDILAALVNKSLIFQQGEDEGRRFGMLETLREYAQEKLVASGEEAIARQRHAAYYLELIEAWARTDSDSQLLIARLEGEYRNLRIALQWAIEQNQSGLALELAVALWEYWTTRGSPNEGRYWLTRVLAVKPPARTPKRIHALLELGALALYQPDIQQAQPFFQEAAALAREFDDRHALGKALGWLGEIAQFQGNYELARTLYLEGLALHHEIGDSAGNETGWALHHLGSLALEQGALEEAERFFTESLNLFQTGGASTRDRLMAIAHTQAKLGLVSLEHQHYAKAAELLETSLAQLRVLIAEWNWAWVIEHLGHAVLGLGDLKRAAELFRQSLRIQFEGKAFHGIAHNLQGLAAIALAEGQGQRAVRLLSGAQLIYDRYPLPVLRRQHFDSSVARSRDALDPLAFNAAWREGQATPLAQLVADELGNLR